MTQLTDSGCTLLKSLRFLKRLGLAGTQVTDAALAEIASLAELEELILSGTRITDDGLASLKRLGQLRHLALDHTEISDEATFHLAGLSGLTYLSAMHTQISDAAVGPLSQLKNLQHLCLVGTRVTRSGIEQLRQALPACHIHFDDGDSVDLLPLVKAGLHSVRGKWRFEGRSIVSPNVAAGCLQIPYTPPDEYVLEAVAERRSGDDALQFGIVVDGKQCVVTLDSFPPRD